MELRRRLVAGPAPAAEDGGGLFGEGGHTVVFLVQAARWRRAASAVVFLALLLRRVSKLVG